MTPDDRTRTAAPATHTFDPAVDAGLAAAFGSDPDRTPGGWSRPPLLRDDPSEHAPLVQPSSPEMPRNPDERYQLLGEIARGGMGVVLKGRDPDLGRDLAFKVLRTELAGKPAAEQRFVEEAQVGGQLQHPGVVPVYDLGRFADGRPYFAMKLVKGRTLADLLAERLSPADDRGRFVQMFLQVCQTVAYAHSKGVIHRDLKPSNVMVGGFGEVLVMDWGLAKVLPRGGIADELKASQASRERERPEEPAEEFTEIKTVRFGSGSDTATGSVMGTPAFMPPEQAGGEVEKLDERADVFGLGAVLCVVLTGKPPYLAATGEAVRLMAIRGELTPAFARLDGCGADAELVGLCKRCLAADRDARPRHAGEVAAAVAAHLAGVERRAHDAELARVAAEARAAEEVNTRRVAEEKAAEERKRRRTQLALAACALLVVGLVGAGAWRWEREAARWAAAEATRREEQATEQARVEQVVGEAVEQAHRDLARGRWADARTALDRADDRLAGKDWPEGFGRRVAAARRDLDFAFAAAEARLAGGAVRADLNLFNSDRTVAAHRAAFDRYGLPVWELTPAEVADRVRPSRVAAAVAAALDDWSWWDPDPALRDRLRAAADAVDGNPWRERARAAIAANDRAALAAVVADPAVHAQPPEFLDLLVRRSAGPERVTLLRAIQLRHPNDFWANEHLGLALDWTDPVQAADRIGYLRAAVAVRPQSPGAWQNLGVDLSMRKDWDGAVAAIREAIRLEPRYNAALRHMGQVLLDKGDLNGAEAFARETIRSHPDMAAGHHILAATLGRKGDHDGSIAAGREAVRLEPADGASWKNLGVALDAKKEPDAALRAYREAVRVAPKLPHARNALAVALAERGDPAAALPHAREAVQLDPRNAEYWNNLGLNLVKLKDSAEAVRAFREAVRLDPKLGRAHRNLGDTLAGQKDWNGAAAAYRKVLELFPKDYQVSVALTSALLSAGKPLDAYSWATQALALNPTWSERVNGLVYNRACAAALCGTGRGPRVTTPEQAQTFRTRALADLKTELGNLSRRLAASDNNREGVRFLTTHMLTDPDLAGVRDSDGLAKQTTDERAAWTEFWDQVRDLRDRVTPPAAPPPRAKR
jgi:serine/threonine-protein kinase